MLESKATLMFHSRFPQIICCLLVSFCAALTAQEVTATMAGTVKDVTGSAVAGAAISVTNVDTNIARTTTSGPAGDYLIALLPPGKYRVTISQAGFKTYERSGVVLEVNEHADIDVALQIGSLNERVEVSGEVPLISTEDSEIGKVIDSQSILQIPLNGRVNIMGLLALAPGIQNAGAQDQVPYYGITPTVAGGSNTGSISFTLDGMTNQATWIERGLVEYPPLDGIQEFKVITSGATAEFGKPNQVIVVSKSGTNELHGELYEYNRNRILTAKNFFATALSLPAYNRNEYGGNFSGPVMIPHVYSGKNRTFYFMNYEGFNLVQASTSSQAVATQAMRQGNFAGLAAITDPLTGSPFPGNQIPNTRLNTVDQKLGNLYPLPDTAGTGAAGTGTNLVQNIGYLSSVQRGSVRLDHRLSESTQLGFTLLVEDLGPNPSVGPVSTFGGLAGIGEHLVLPILTINHIFSPTVVSETRFGYQHERVFRVPQNFNLNSASIIPGLPVQPIDGAPQITITNIVSMSEAGSSDLQQDLSGQENLTMVRGSHSLKIGFNYDFTTHYNIAEESPQRGAYNFNGQYSGNAYADFVLGYPTTTQLPQPAALAGKYIANRYGAYVQDVWKATDRLTLNVGVRYDLQWIRPVAYGQASLFIPNLNKVLVFASNYPAGTIPAALSTYPVSLAASAGYPTSLMTYLGQNPSNFAPRVGVAYKIAPKTVFRGGFGIYYNVLNLNYTQSAQTNLPFLTVGTYEQPSGKVPGFTMYDPFPGNGSLPANPNAQAYSPTKTPYNIQWNSTLEHELHGGFALRLSYVGQRNVANLGSPNINQPLPQAGAVQQFRPYQPFATITFNNDPIYQSTTHIVEGGVEKRYAKGLLVTAQYQFTRAIGTETYMSPINYNDSRGNLTGIRKNSLVSSFVYDLPFGKGRVFGAGWNRTMDTLLGSWQFSGVVTALSGSPFSPSYSTSVQGNVAGRPNYVGGVSLYPAQKSIAQWFNPAAFGVPTVFTFGNEGYDQLWGPGSQNWDLSLSKTLSITERWKLQLRFESFNAFNHPQFGNPSTDITNKATVATITSSGEARTVQLGAKLTF
jgi:hypothetical protein